MAAIGIFIPRSHGSRCFYEGVGLPGVGPCQSNLRYIFTVTGELFVCGRSSDPRKMKMASLRKGIKDKLTVLLKLVYAMIKEPWLLFVSDCYLAIVSGSASGVESRDPRQEMAKDEFPRRDYCMENGPSEQPKAIRRLFDMIDEDGDGRISVDEMDRFLVKLNGLSLADGSCLEMMSDVLSASVLTDDHSNNNGQDREMDSIDFQTFLRLHDDVVGVGRQEMGGAWTGEDVVEEVFGVFDENGDGFISAEELQRVLCALGLQEGHRLFDCQNMIRGVDANFDGKVDISEFRELMKMNSLHVSAR